MDEQKFREIAEKIEDLKKKKGVDLSSEEDLSIAVMNLVSLEEHFFYTAEKTGKSDYFDLLKEVREIRKSLLGRMIDSHEGETWCISKHLLAATMRITEVGTKYLADGRKEEAEKVFHEAYRVYSMFWALRLKLLSLKDVKKVSDGALNVHDEAKKQGWGMEEILSKLIDCCKE